MCPSFLVASISPVLPIFVVNNGNLHVENIVILYVSVLLGLHDSRFTVLSSNNDNLYVKNMYESLLLGQLDSVLLRLVLNNGNLHGITICRKCSNTVCVSVTWSPRLPFYCG